VIVRKRRGDAGTRGRGVGEARQSDMHRRDEPIT
jgi:hypothetical protein